jgi:hypothetical protein
VKKLAALAALAACAPPSGECHVDSECDGYTCANTNECLSADDVRRVSIAWTVNGLPASPAQCVPSPTFTLMIVDSATGEYKAWAPVDCALGLFVFDKLPTRFDTAELMGDGGFGTFGPIADDGNAMLNIR